MSLAAALLLAATTPAAAQPVPPIPPEFAEPRDAARVAVIERVAKSVLRIKSFKPAVEAGADALTPLDMGSAEREKLKRKNPMLFDRLTMPMKARPIHEEGTGFVYDSARGLIVTAAHIVDSGGAITVFLPDGTEKPVELVGADRNIGLAILKLPGNTLPALALAPRKPKIGETVLIVGRLLPFDSVGASQGMVVGEARGADEIAGDRPVLVDYLMLDNLLPNGGMGGGPVVSMRGDVIGIVSAVWGRNGYGQDAATLAIPLLDLRPQIDELIRAGKIVRSEMGIWLDCDAGDCRIAGMKPGGPAQVAGLKEGDTLISVNGVPVKGSNALQRMIAPMPVGSDVTVIVRRGEQPITAKIQTVELVSGPS